MRVLRALFQSKAGRDVQRNLTACSFIFPATLIIGVFGVFPVAFAFFVSLHRWRRFPEVFTGLANYERALGSLGYILFFWLALAAIALSLITLYRHVRNHKARIWGLLPAGITTGVFTCTVIWWFFELLPVALAVPQRLPLREPRNRAKFIEEFVNSFAFESVTRAFYPMLVVGAIALVLTTLTFRVLGTDYITWYRFAFATTLLIGGVWLLNLTLEGIDTAIATARANDAELPIWSQTIFISLGAALIGLAYWLWAGAVKQMRDLQFVLRTAAAFLLLFGGYLLVIQLPNALTHSDPELMQGFWVTIMYVLGTVPVQLSLGLGLAYFLFYITKGKTFYRVMYFLPYITPFAATAVVFSILFSNRENSPINRIITALGLDPQKWLLEPTPVNELILGIKLPQLLEGPGLALLVIMIWSSWTYVGYDIVIFLAGLGNINSEYYEAAKIDGASGWAIFRHITLPLLSPTTFFLSLIAIIGTFQAFTQIWIMRRPSAYDAVDTVGVYLYETISSASPRYGYGSAMAFVLFGIILLVTLFQNRLLGRRVFYG